MYWPKLQEEFEPFIHLRIILRSRGSARKRQLCLYFIFNFFCCYFVVNPPSFAHIITFLPYRKRHNGSQKVNAGDGNEAPANGIRMLCQFRKRSTRTTPHYVSLPYPLRTRRVAPRFFMGPISWTSLSTRTVRDKSAAAGESLSAPQLLRLSPPQVFTHSLSPPLYIFYTAPLFTCVP